MMYGCTFIFLAMMHDTITCKSLAVNVRTQAHDLFLSLDVQDAVAAAGRAILRNVVGHGGGEGSWMAEKRMVRCMSAKGQLERAEEACANALEDLVENKAGLLAVGEAQLELAGVLLRLCKYEECLDGLQR